jgi:hypothetical protein
LQQLVPTLVALAPSMGWERVLPVLRLLVASKPGVVATRCDALNVTAVPDMSAQFAAVWIVW